MEVFDVKPHLCIMCGQTLTLSMIGWIAHRLDDFATHYPHSLQHARENARTRR